MNRLHKILYPQLPTDSVQQDNAMWDQMCRDGEKYQAELDKKTEEYWMDYGTWDEFFNESNGQERRDLWLLRNDPTALGQLWLRFYKRYCEHLAKTEE